MAISHLSDKDKARRLDLLLTPPEEYAYALLYFTGSDKFNILFRKKAIEKGYSLSEHGFKKLNTKVETPPYMEDERNIFTFLDIPYVTPNKRT
jgi:DNA polymerase/3'-5' exonuclease PolX